MRADPPAWSPVTMWLVGTPARTHRSPAGTMNGAESCSVLLTQLSDIRSIFWRTVDGPGEPGVSAFDLHVRGALSNWRTFPTSVG